MERTISLSDRELHYWHEIKNVKNINIRIRPDMAVYVSSNPQTELAEVEKVLLEKRAYICLALDRYADMREYAYVAHDHEYVNGESFRYLERYLRLKVSKGDRNTVDTDGIYLYLAVKEDKDELKKQLTEQWFSEMREREIGAICRETYQYFRKYDVEFPQIRFRNMVSRWCSCQPKRKVITLN